MVLFFQASHFIFYFIHLFVFGCVGASSLHVGFPLTVAGGGYLSCSAQASRGRGCSCLQSTVRIKVGSVVVAARLESTGLVVAAHSLVAPLPVGSSLIRDRTRLLHWQADSLPLSRQGRSPVCGFIIQSGESLPPAPQRAATIYTDSPSEARVGSLPVECFCTLAGGGPGRRTLRTREVCPQACGSDAWSVGLCPLS